MNPNDIQIQMQSLNGSKQLDQLFAESEDLRLSKNNSDERMSAFEIIKFAKIFQFNQV